MLCLWDGRSIGAGSPQQLALHQGRPGEPCWLGLGPLARGYWVFQGPCGFQVIVPVLFDPTKSDWLPVPWMGALCPSLICRLPPGLVGRAPCVARVLSGAPP